MTDSAVPVLIGTYNGPHSRGIYRCTLDRGKGTLSSPTLLIEAERASYLALHPGGRLLACNEVSRFNGQPTGAVSSFEINSERTRLTRIDQQSSGGGGPAYVSIDPSGKHVFVANYGTGSVAACALDDAGHLGKPLVLQLYGSGPDHARQEGPHAHSIVPDPTGKFALACDLGTDRVLVYRIVADKLVEQPDAALAAPPGSGPRHVVFGREGRVVYVITEMGSSVLTLDFDPASGRLSLLQNVPALPSEARALYNKAAAIKLHPGGKLLYVSNRGNESIALFTVEGSRGLIASAGWFGCGVKSPRDFAIDPSGQFLIAAGEESDNLALFRIDPANGKLSICGGTSLGKPVCVLFA